MPDSTSYSFAPDTAAVLPDILPRTLVSRPEKKDFLVPVSEYGKERVVDTLVSDKGGSHLAFRPLDLKAMAIPEAPGFTGTPRPCRLGEDNGLTVSLLLSLVILVLVWTRSARYFHHSVWSIFRNGSLTADETARTGNEWQGVFVLILISCFSLSLFYYAYLEDLAVPFLYDLPSRRIIIPVTGVLLVCFFLKVLLYTFVNAVFFTRAQSRVWMETYLLVMAGSSLVLLPAALLVACVGLDGQCRLYALLFVAIMVKTALFFCCSRTFFPTFRRSMHLFLYFCTFEILPALVLWRVLFWAVSYTASVQ